MIVLGSGSRARKSLLELVDIKPDRIVEPSIDETVKNSELPLGYVKRMAFEKSEEIEIEQCDLLITADTIVVTGRTIHHKTIDIDIARQSLRALTGRKHRVYTAFCLRHKNRTECGIEKTILRMKYLTDFEIEEYLKTNEWKNKAGGYGIQGKGMGLFLNINGCYSNVVGLPLPKLINKLKGLGYLKKKSNK